MINNRITLAIETALRGGSLSLIKNNTEIDYWAGNTNVSRADDILEQISLILKNNRVKNPDLTAISTGPGSATGIRIGLATALGLKKSLDCEIAEVSLFEAIAFGEKFDERTLAAIPVGGKQIAWHIFSAGSSFEKYNIADTKQDRIAAFSKVVDEEIFSKILLHTELAGHFSVNHPAKSVQIKIMDDKFATLIGFCAQQLKHQKRV